jgi:hypothetical protein
MSGCVGLIGGDLKGVDHEQVKVGQCEHENEQRFHQIVVTSNAKNDGISNPAALVSAWTLGIVPTYWLTFVESRAMVYEGDRLVDTYSYRSKAHKFYGIIWPFIVSPLSSDVNQIPADEGGGIRVKWAVEDKTAAKAAHRAQQEHGLEPSQMCYRYEDWSS